MTRYYNSVNKILHLGTKAANVLDTEVNEVEKMNDKDYILVVDDTPDAALLLADLLEIAGYKTKTANGGKETLNLIQKYKTVGTLPQLILLDLMMPDISGLEVTRQIKNDQSLPFIPIIITTASPENESRVTGLQSGADDFLTKPVNRAELLARVRSLIRLKNAYDEKTRLLVEVQTAYDKLHTAQADLVEAAKKQAQMEGMITTAAAICHEMSQPLTSGLITMQFIQQEDQLLNPDLQTIEQSLLQARAILDKLRALTRYETKPYVGLERMLDLDRSAVPQERQRVILDDDLIG